MAEVAMTKKTQEETSDERPVVLKVDHVAKMFRLPTEQATGLKMAFLNWTKGIKGYTEQHVLRDINFEVRQGDFFGIVGRNGSGKSTLLKIISQIYTPEQGSVTVKGKLVPFIELGVGFNPELTGRENVYLNGALLGFTRAEIDAMYDDIVEFAELEDFMDQLAVGDEAFQRKCDNFFAEIKKDPTKTVILVTHSMDAVKKYCNKAILIKDGEIIASGDKNNVADMYTEENLKSNKQRKQNEEGIYEQGLNKMCPMLQIKPVSNVVVDGSSPFEFDIEYKVNAKSSKDLFITFTLFDAKRGGIVYDSADSLRIVELGHHTAHLQLPLSLFTNGDFKLQAAMMTPDPDRPGHPKQIAYTNEDNSCFFAIRESGHRNGYGLINNNSLSITQRD